MASDQLDSNFDVARVSCVETFESSIGSYMSNYEVIYHSRHSESFLTRTKIVQRTGSSGPELDTRSERLSHCVEPRDVPNIHLRCDEAIVSI